MGPLSGLAFSCIRQSHHDVLFQQGLDTSLYGRQQGGPATG